MAIVSDSMGPADFAAITGNSNNGWGDGSVWIWVLLLFALMGGWGNNGNNGGNGFIGYPIMGNTVQNGFDQAALMASINGISSNIYNGFANAEVSRCNGQTNILQALNNNQANLTTQLNTLAMNQQNCCCENRAAVADVKYAVANEGATVRSNTDAKVQMVMDKLCQLELDGVKAQVEAKNDRIAELQTQLNMANLAASQTAQNAFIQQGFANEVDQLYNRLNNCPVPTTPVYGRTPIFTCNQNGCGCGCGM